MGRIRIKKKGRVLAFRETVAYRFILVAVAAILFAVAVFQIFSALGSGGTLALVLASLTAAAAVVLGLYNFSRMQTAKIPRQTLQRLKRR